MSKTKQKINFAKPTFKHQKYPKNKSIYKNKILILNVFFETIYVMFFELEKKEK